MRLLIGECLSAIAAIGLTDLIGRQWDAYLSFAFRMVRMAVGYLVAYHNDCDCRLVEMRARRDLSSFLFNILGS